MFGAKALHSFLTRGAVRGTRAYLMIRRLLSSGTVDGPGKLAPAGELPRKQFKMEAEIAGAFMAIAIAGFGALKHFDSKFEEMNKKFDQMHKTSGDKFDQMHKTSGDKFEEMNKKFDQMDKQFGHKFDRVQATISDLSARFERQCGFAEGVRSVRVSAPPSSETEERGAR